MLGVVSVTTHNHAVDHKWSIGVFRLSSCIWVSIVIIFQEEHGGGAKVMPVPRDRPQVVNRSEVVSRSVPKLSSYI